jgi:hypothetical protein
MRILPEYASGSRFIGWCNDCLISVAPSGLNWLGMVMQQTVWQFEQEPSDEIVDETSINLRAYFDHMPDEKMRQYSPDWTDEQVMAWDDNFRDDGCLFLICSERDVEVDEYRRVLEACIRYRDRVRADILGEPK